VATATAERDTVRAQARYVRCSARKARLVLEHIRGKSAPEARAILSFQPRAAARDAGKVLASAIANAEANNGFDADDMIVFAAYADEGPTLKRWRARARGRVNRIRKRTCHITIVLAVAEPGEIRRRLPAPVEVAPAEPAAEERPRRTRGKRRAAADAAPEAAEPQPEAVEEEPAAAAEPEAETAEEPEAADEPEAAAEPEAEPEPEPEAANADEDTPEQPEEES
jgi:large subunit ribosomal protein L22